MIEGNAAPPVPDKLIELGEPVALCVIETEAVFAPVVVGLNVTAIVQVPAGARLVVAVHAPVAVPKENSVELVPASANALKTRLAVPLFVTVTV